MNKAATPTTYKPIFDYIDQVIKPLATKKDVSHLPTKDEIYKRMDQMMGELKAIRENQDATTSILQGHEDRLDTIETKLQIVIN